MLAGRYPSDQFAGLRPRVVWDRVAGPRPRPRRRAARRGRERRHDPRPRPVRRVPPRRRARRRARRGDGLREPRRRVLRARRVHVADRGDHLRPRRRHARAGRAREDPVLEGRPPGPAARARPRARRARARAARRARRRRGEAARASGLDDARRVEPPRVPRRAGRGDRRDPRRPHDRDRALRRRDRRLARLHPHAVRRARARAVGARDRGEARPRSTCPCRCCGATTASSAACPSRSTRSRSTCCSSTPTSSTSSSSRGVPSTSLFASQFRENAARALLLPRRRPGERTPLWQQRQRAADLLEVASRLPDVPDPARDDARVPAATCSTSPRCARCSPTSGPASVRVVPGRDPPRVAVRAEPAVRLDRGVHVRGRRAARRTPGRRARARPRPAARPLGAEELRELLDPAVIAELELELQRLAPDAPGPPRRRPARSARRSRPARRSTRSRARCTADPRRVDRRAARRAARHPRRQPARRGRGRGPPARRARPRDPAGPARPRSPIRSTARSTISSPATRARTFRSRSTSVVARLGVTAERALARADPARSRRPRRARRVPARRQSSASGATRTCCASLRRRSLAALRHEVEPVDAATFARFLAAWQGVGRGRRGTDALVEAIEQLQGVAIPASVLERDVLPARVDGYRPAMLDELCAAGELVWIGAGALGADDGRVRLFFRDRVKLLASSVVLPEAARRPDARRDPRPARAARARRSGPTSSPRPAPPTTRCVLTALWDLVWAGEVTNDTFGPLRVPRRASAKRSTRAPARIPGRLDPPRPARGRGPLVARRAAARARADAHRARARDRAAAARTPRRRHARSRARRGHARRLRRRLPRAARARGVGPGPARLVRRRARRRAVRAAGRGRPPARAPQPPTPTSPAASLVLAATDPAQPYGAALGWPEHAGGGRPSRAAGAHVVLVDGECVAYLERGGRGAAHVRARVATDDPDAWVDALVEAHKEGRLGRLQIERIDDEPARTSPHAPALRAAGFADGYKGLTLPSSVSLRATVPARSEVSPWVFSTRSRTRPARPPIRPSTRPRSARRSSTTRGCRRRSTTCCQEIGALVVAQRRNEAPDDAAAQIDAKVAEIAEIEKQMEANNVAGRQRRAPAKPPPS